MVTKKVAFRCSCLAKFSIFDLRSIMELLLALFNTWTGGQWLAVCAIFIWSGFVRTGLGFGGAALALPFLLMVKPDPLYWLPIVAIQLLFFTALTVSHRLKNIDWQYLGKSLSIMIIPKIIGVLGLITLPPIVLVVFVYSVTLVYALTYIFGYVIKSRYRWLDTLLLVLGGYVTGTSLIGAPLIAAVYAQHVAIHQLRDTLFVLWFILVTIKMSTFIVLDVPLNGQMCVLLIPIVAIGHLIGLRVHQQLLEAGGVTFKKYIGLGLALVCLVGLWRALSLA